jgi:hypothetical protein
VEVNLIKYLYHPSTVITDGLATIDCISSDDFCAGYDVGAFATTGPMSFQIDLSHSNGFGAIVISGRLPGSGMEWWQNRLTVYIGSDGNIQFRDGQNTDSL